VKRAGISLLATNDFFRSVEGLRVLAFVVFLPSFIALIDLKQKITNGRFLTQSWI